MRTHLWRLVSVLVLLAMFVSPIGSAAAAPRSSQTAAPKSNMQVINASFVGVSKPLSTLAPVKVEASAAAIARSQKERLTFPKTENALTNGGFDASIVQNGPVGNSMPAPVANFEGVNNVSGVLPPDTQGDVGFDPATSTKYYVQWVNLAFEIWDVTNPAAPTSLYGPAAGNTLWAGTGTICAANNDGDPITQFDHLSNRWMMSQFALGFPNDFHQCIAVSATADPTGVWYLYDFQTSTVVMNDYPHFGVWPDGYYMTVNQFDGATFGWEGAGVAVFERTAMLAGLPARMIYIDIGAVTLNYGGMLPSDLDGPAPAAGTPNYFMEWDDSSWLGDANDTLRIWEFKTDWAVPANTTFGANVSYDPNAFITTANVDPNMCGGARSCIPQPGTAAGLDAIADRLMYRLQYRDFGSYQTLVGNHTVDATSADKAGIHWFELRDTGTGFAMNQEGVYTSGADNVWMGSAAMDAVGDIALGFSVASGTTYPSIRYTGRLAADPANTLPQGEGSLVVGSGSQTHSAARWGDYSMLAIDSTDNCTFWYTQEYMQTTSSAGWQTRIGSFKFPSCTTAPTGVLSGTITDSLSAPIAGASVDVSGGYSTITDATGHYALDLVDGTYTVTASKYGYVPSTVPGVVVTAPNTTTQNFSLAAATTSTISGVVTDSATGWPLYARIDIFGFPGGPVFTNPVTGAYSVPLVDAPYTFTVSAMSGGYTNAVLPLIVSGDATQDFSLTAAASCTAVGYTPGASVLSEGFESVTFPPTGWNVYETGDANPGIKTGTTGTTGSHGSSHGGTNFAWHDDDFGSTATGIISWLATPQISVPAGGSLSFWQRGYWGGYYTYHSVWITTGASPDPTVSTYVELWNGNTAEAWSQQIVDLSAYGGQNVYLAFEYEGDFSDEWYLDDVAVQSACHPVPGTGLVVGSVFDANTSTLISNASVQDAALNPALIIDSSADLASPAQMYVIAQPAGAQALTASALNFASNTQSPVVVAGGTVKQDFNLASGNLSASPTSMTFNVTTSAPAAVAPLAINNTGAAAANFEVFAMPGTFAGYEPTGPFAANTRHTGPKNLNDLDASKLRIDFTPQGIPEIAGGEISTSWPTGLTYAWGIGFNTDNNDLWLGNIAAAGGDNLNYRFTTAGVNTGDTIDTAPWVGSFAGDMTYNPFSNMLWQVNVGGDNCIYEMNPATNSSTGNKICPAFGTPERGLAFDPLTNTYYAGSWTDGIINHFAPDGTMLASIDVGLNTSGLAFNPSTGHLFVLTNGSGYPDVYVLDVNTPGYDILGAFYLKQGATKVFATGGQAGLEIDCAGNLWAVNQNAQMVYSAASGETGVCNWQASWLSATPATGSVTAAGTTPTAIGVDATGLSTGAHQGYLRIVSNTPYGDEIVPVTLNVSASPVFSDVPLVHWANSWIERLYVAGITGGCGTGPLIYCPGTNVTRAQMAVFILRAEHGASYVPPPATGTVFTDVPVGSFGAAFIEQLKAEGITSGCTPTTFCPNTPITRGQMAVFLLRGKYGSAYAPPPATGTVFTDVTVSTSYAAFIEQLFAEGITSGCGGGNYCPSSPITRAEMAVMIVRTFGLP
ncbi:MAG: carboxypeptidase regulatory-like domain-containing protein [Chloroflexi bacterium]|nr:carboxypeptidase regulatory-like domain-containing protein [Chloroflexota bacterium]